MGHYKKEKNQIDLPLSIDQEELIHNIENNLDHDELVEFIKRLEKCAEDADVLYQLRDYFVEEARKMDEALKETEEE